MYENSAGWEGGWGGSSRPLDKGEPWSIKKFFRPLRGGGEGGPSPGSATGKLPRRRWLGHAGDPSNRAYL